MMVCIEPSCAATTEDPFEDGWIPMMLEHYDVGKIVCPFCAVIHDCAMSAGPEPGAPEDGNINICINCEQVSVYEQEAPGGLRPPTPEELEEALQQDEVQKALWALRRSHYVIKKENN